MSGKDKMDYGDEDAQWDYPEPEDKTGWRHYERIFRDENGVHNGRCRWSAPPMPIDGDVVLDPDVRIQDGKTLQFHPIPPGFMAPLEPGDRWI